MGKENNNLSLFIFRRDLRLDDNTGLIKALAESDMVIPLFIFTPTQVSDANKFKSSNAIQFMIESLYDLDDQIRASNPKCQLWTKYGDELDVIKELHQKLHLSAIYINEDYTPYAIKRDTAIKNFCEDEGIYFNASTDILLLDNQNIQSKNGNPYHNFTLFYKKGLTFPIRKPNYNVGNNFKSPVKSFKKWQLPFVDKYLLDENFYQINNDLAEIGGRNNGLEIIKSITQFRDYQKTKNILSKPTTQISAHNKFGTVSIREVYYAFRKEKSGELCKNLYWRDFYYYVSVHFKQFYRYEHIFKQINNKSKFAWDNNSKYFKAWKDGKTGFPLVDAAMRQLNTIGFMHNRGRLVVAQFLTKDLLIDWKYGERYFGKKLVDVDRAQNVGNWNWAASYGLDSTQFLRIFNPWTQSKQFDPECTYIKKWVPELENVPPQHIHQWYKYYGDYPELNYPEPIVDHNKQRKKFIQFYKNYFVKVKKDKFKK